MRELARAVGKAPSYLSDIEHGHRVPAEAVVLELCAVLDLDADAMLGLAGRLGEDADQYLRREPVAGVLFRRVQEHGLNAQDLRQLIERADELAKGHAKKGGKSRS